MLSAIELLVRAESPTDDLAACLACSEVVEEVAADLLGARAQRIAVGERTHLRWQFGSHPRLLLVGHFDTVWPVGTVVGWPFASLDGMATGPGIFDMKAGIVQMLFALTAVEALDDVAILLIADEEKGSPTGRHLLVREAAQIEAALILEPSEQGALKTQRKGVHLYRVDVTGRAAHAGLDPEKGAMPPSSLLFNCPP